MHNPQHFAAAKAATLEAGNAAAAIAAASAVDVRLTFLERRIAELERDHDRAVSDTGALIDKDADRERRLRHVEALAVAAKDAATVLQAETAAAVTQAAEARSEAASAAARVQQAREAYTADVAAVRRADGEREEQARRALDARWEVMKGGFGALEASVQAVQRDARAALDQLAARITARQDSQALELEKALNDADRRMADDRTELEAAVARAVQAAEAARVDAAQATARATALAEQNKDLMRRVADSEEAVRTLQWRVASLIRHFGGGGADLGVGLTPGGASVSSASLVGTAATAVTDGHSPTAASTAAQWGLSRAASGQSPARRQNSATIGDLSVLSGRGSAEFEAETQAILAREAAALKAVRGGAAGAPAASGAVTPASTQQTAGPATPASPSALLRRTGQLLTDDAVTNEMQRLIQRQQHHQQARSVSPVASPAYIRRQVSSTAGEF